MGSLTRHSDSKIISSEEENEPFGFEVEDPANSGTDEFSLRELLARSPPHTIPEMNHDEETTKNSPRRRIVDNNHEEIAAKNAARMKSDARDPWKPIFVRDSEGMVSEKKEQEANQRKHGSYHGYRSRSAPLPCDSEYPDIRMNTNDEDGGDNKCHSDAIVSYSYSPYASKGVLAFLASPVLKPLKTSAAAVRAFSNHNPKKASDINRRKIPRHTTNREKNLVKNTNKYFDLNKMITAKPQERTHTSGSKPSAFLGSPIMLSQSTINERERNIQEAIKYCRNCYYGTKD